MEQACDAGKCLIGTMTFDELESEGGVVFTQAEYREDLDNIKQELRDETVWINWFNYCPKCGFPIIR